jgi:hypothetical protein
MLLRWASGTRAAIEASLHHLPTGGLMQVGLDSAASLPEYTRPIAARPQPEAIIRHHLRATLERADGYSHI